jgi:hypothetical protein
MIGRVKGHFAISIALALLFAACDETRQEQPTSTETPPLEKTAVADPERAAIFEPNPEQVAALNAVLKPQYADFRNDWPGEPWIPAFRAAQYDLDGDGSNELLVRLEGRTACGSGGCTFRIYRQNGKTWRRLSGSTLTFLPIGVARTSTLGWRDIVVSTRRDLVDSGKARLAFNGGTYPPNPTLPPAAPTNEIGTVLISDSSTLFPLID